MTTVGSMTLSLLVRTMARFPTCTSTQPLARLRHPAYSTFLALAPRRSQDFNSGFTSSYDPTLDTGRGPIFAKSTFGVPQFYPRDLKRRVDDYVVGQDRAKKTICSVIFNHYQNLRRRQQHETQAQRLREKLQRQKYAENRDTQERAGYSSSNQVHPVEGGLWTFENLSPTSRSRRQADDRYSIEDEFPGHNESVRGTHQPPPEEQQFNATLPPDDFFVREEAKVPQPVKIDKSNILLIGPTGVGKTYILE